MPELAPPPPPPPRCLNPWWTKDASLPVSQWDDVLVRDEASKLIEIQPGLSGLVNWLLLRSQSECQLSRCSHKSRFQSCLQRGIFQSESWIRSHHSSRCLWQKSSLNCRVLLEPCIEYCPLWQTNFSQKCVCRIKTQWAWLWAYRADGVELGQILGSDCGGLFSLGCAGNPPRPAVARTLVAQFVRWADLPYWALFIDFPRRNISKQ